MAALRLRSNGQPLLACCTHLWFDPKHPDIKVAQADALCAAVVNYRDSNPWGVGWQRAQGGEQAGQQAHGGGQTVQQPPQNQDMAQQMEYHRHSTQQQERHHLPEHHLQVDHHPHQQQGLALPHGAPGVLVTPATQVPVIIAGDFNSLWRKYKSDTFDKVCGHPSADHRPAAAHQAHANACSVEYVPHVSSGSWCEHLHGQHSVRPNVFFSICRLCALASRQEALRHVGIPGERCDHAKSLLWGSCSSHPACGFAAAAACGCRCHQGGGSPAVCMSCCPLAPCRPTTGTTQLPGPCTPGGARGPCQCLQVAQAGHQRLPLLLLVVGLEELCPWHAAARLVVAAAPLLLQPAVVLQTFSRASKQPVVVQLQGVGHLVPPVHNSKQLPGRCLLAKSA